MEKFFWEDWFSERMADLLLGQDVEELAKEMGKDPNTVSCWGYKSKIQSLPNVKRLGEVLDFVNRSRPEAVSRFLRDFCGRFGVVAGSRGEVLRQIAGEVEKQGSGVRGRGSGEVQVKFP
jgi:hypothetical protein